MRMMIKRNKKRYNACCLLLCHANANADADPIPLCLCVLLFPIPTRDAISMPNTIQTLMLMLKEKEETP